MVVAMVVKRKNGAFEKLIQPSRSGSNVSRDRADPWVHKASGHNLVRMGDAERSCEPGMVAFLATVHPEPERDCFGAHYIHPSFS
jgi:hypothetical protein